MKQIDVDFWQGFLLAVSLIYRETGDDRAASNALNEIDNLNYVCRNAAEYDIAPLREVISTLPMGCDADYDEFLVKENMEGERYEVIANRGEESFVIATFDDRELMESQLDAWDDQLSENKE